MASLGYYMSRGPTALKDSVHSAPNGTTWLPTCHRSVDRPHSSLNLLHMNSLLSLSLENAVGPETSFGSAKTVSLKAGPG